MAMAQGNGIASARCRRAGPGGDVAQSRSRHRRTAALDDHRHRFLDLAIARGVLIALDRQERGRAGARLAAQEVTAEFGLPVVAIAGLDDLLAHADERPAIAMHRAALEAYRARYGRQAD